MRTREEIKKELEEDVNKLFFLEAQEKAQRDILYARRKEYESLILQAKEPPQSV